MITFLISVNGISWETVMRINSPDLALPFSSRMNLPRRVKGWKTVVINSAITNLINDRLRTSETDKTVRKIWTRLDAKFSESLLQLQKGTNDL